MNNVKNDWHQADIIAALRKCGPTLAAVSREAELSSSTLANILSCPCSKGEWSFSKYIPQKSGLAAILIRMAD